MRKAADCNPANRRFDSAHQVQNSRSPHLRGETRKGARLGIGRRPSKGNPGGVLGSHVPRQATNLCKVSVVGSIPTESTSNRGGVAQSGERLAGSQKAPGAEPGTSTKYDRCGARWYRRRHGRLNHGAFRCLAGTADPAGGGTCLSLHTRTLPTRLGTKGGHLEWVSSGAGSHLWAHGEVRITRPSHG